MRLDAGIDIHRRTRQLVSLVSSLALALTVVRFGTAHFSAERAQQRRQQAPSPTPGQAPADVG